jgi:hypothetical protein
VQPTSSHPKPYQEKYFVKKTRCRPLLFDAAPAVIDIPNLLANAGFWVYSLHSLLQPTGTLHGKSSI